jgi:hypothetical protein
MRPLIVSRFPLGRVVITANAARHLSQAEILAALRRHGLGDWGDTHPEDEGQNDLALRNGERLFSVYHSGSGQTFWIITEWDRSASTVLLPDDY